MLESLEQRALLAGVEGLLSPITLDSTYATQVIFHTDFESDDGGFTAVNTGGTLPGLWHYSVGRYADGQSGHTPDHNWYYGQFESSVGGGSYVQSLSLIHISEPTRPY